ncbi:MAG TPA: ABC transporter ATP-binding protein [Spirochaetia bacterium]|nr:ABC transporter ATP-binding protein [Spirochaetia bacterium]
MIDIDKMDFGYGRSKLFSGLSLTVDPGNIYGLLGKNGAGKTTLLKIISGLLFAERGECSTLGANPRHRSPAMLADIYYLPEEFYLPSVRPMQYAKLYGAFYPRFSTEGFTGYLKEFDLGSETKVTAYSYGQKKKFLLAFGLATGARLLLLDEPTNGLDIPSKSQFRRIVASALTDDRTFLISTHQVRDMENLIDPVIIIEDGRIIFNRAIDEVMRKVKISVQKTEPDPEKVLYFEKTLGGYAVVSPGDNEGDTSIDLETLFNVVTTAKDRLETLFDGDTKGAQK